MITKPWTYWAIFFLWVALFFRTSEVQGGGPEPVTVIDIAVLWTPALAALQRDDLAEQARSWVEGVNGALMNSEARVRLRLVHSGKVTYPFNPEQLGHALEPHTAKLARLLDPNDGFFDAAQSIRDAVSADLLVVVTPGELDPAHAALVAAEPRLGFGVTSLKTEHEFARVVGRLMGCAGVENDPALGPVGSGAFADSQAFRLTNTHYSTLMGAEPVFPVFSTPGVQALGQPLGIAGVADNVRTWNVRAAEVAAFRAPLGSAQTPVVTWTLPRTGSVFAQGSEIQLEVAAQGSSANLREIEILAVDAVSGLPRLLPARMSRGTVSPHRAAIPGVLPQWGRLVARATDEAGVAAQSTVEFRVPPPNDDFVRRESIPPAGGSLLLRVGGSSLEPGEPAWEAGINGSVWWTWTAPGAGSLKLEWESSGLPRSHVRVFRGAAWGQWVAAGEMGPGTNSVIGTKAGEVLQIAAGLGQFFGPDPEERLRVTFFPALANDEFASAIELSGTNLSVTGHVFGARGEADITAVPWLGERGTVW